MVSYRADLRGFQRLRAQLHDAIGAERPVAPWRLPEEDPAATLFGDERNAADDNSSSRSHDVSRDSPEVR